MKYFYNGILNDYMPFDTEENGFFETIRVFKGKPVFLDDHVQRCKNAMSFFEIVNNEIDFEKIILEHISVFYNLLKTDYIRFRIQFDFDKKDTAIFIWSQGELLKKNICLYNKLYINCNYYYQKGEFLNEYRNFKNKSRAIYRAAKANAEMEGRFDSIIVDPEKNISDTSICNVFAIIDDVVHTPGLDSGALNGVLRKNLILLLKSNGYKVVEGKISETELLNADEIFLTNVIRGIVPVNQLQEKIFIKQSVTNKIKVLFGEKNESFKQLGV